MSILWLILKTLGSLLVVACCLRAYLQVVRLHPHNPVSKLTFQMTDWIVLPVRRITPGTAGVDWASLLAAVVLSLLLTVVFYFLTRWQMSGLTVADSGPVVRPFGWLVALACVWMVPWSLQLAVVILIAGVLMSWLSPMNPLKPVFDLLAQPMLAPFQRLLQRGAGARRSGFDLSPIGAFLMLQVAAALMTSLEASVLQHLF
jgi:YggT family protein